LHDVAGVADSTDIPTGYALVNSRRAVYIPVTKRPDASTLTVVDEVKQSLARFRTLVPSDIDVSYQFDQSRYVKNALFSVVREGLLGALLTGLVVLLFLGDWRSSFIVVTTIPFALLSSVVGLWISGQTINIMTLGGLALAVGILVDEGVVEIENIDSTLIQEPEQPVARGVLDATRRTVVPRFLSMLTIVAVFVPSFFMTGVAKNLFVPFSLAVAFAMMASFLLSSSLLPVLFLWMHRAKVAGRAVVPMGWMNFDRVRERWSKVLERLAPLRALVLVIYLVAAVAILALLAPLLGRELFPNVTGQQFRLRFDAPAGTRAEETAQLVTSVLDQINASAGQGNVDISLGYVGTQGASYPINTVFLWTSGPHEAVINVALRPSAGVGLVSLEEKLRGALPAKFPGCSFSFEPGDIVSQIMNFGAPTPVELAATGPDFATLRAYTEKLRNAVEQVAAIRDLRIEQPLNYPSVDVRMNREMAGQLGVTAGQVARSLSEATASSRFTTPNYWTDPKTGVAYQVQVQYPQPRMTSVQDVQNIPVTPGDAAHPLIGDLARVTEGTMVGEYDRINGLWLLSLAANVASEDLGRVANQIDVAIHAAGELPRGATVQVRGQVAAMRATFANLGVGLLLAMVVILMLLAANFESLRLSLVIFTTVPATLCGVVLMLLATHTTLNIESYMGAIMALGVGTANAILLVTFAEEHRRAGGPALEAGIEAARARMRPIVMTSAAMIAGMIPMALAWGEGAEVDAPLGRAVIGGLAAATLANLTVLPFVFALVQGRASTRSASLDPDEDENR
jgi:multidrug efflux pump subunit AcrB